MQPPMEKTGNDDVARQPRAMQEEDQADRHLRRHGEPGRRLAMDRQDRCQKHGEKQEQGERVGKVAAHVCHGLDGENVLPRNVIMKQDARNNSYRESG
ncbi:hypothetical protein FQZ97_1196250 [compost metagenome]